MNETAGKYVLLAEDSTVTQDIVKLVLGQRGHRLDIAGDGQEALELLLANSYDLALIDYHLPIKDGLQAVQEFVKERDGEMIPRVIGLTGDVEGLLSADKSGQLFDLVLSKPFKIDQIIPIIEADDSVPRQYSSINVEIAPTEEAREQSADALPFEELGYYLIYFPRDFYQGARNAVSQRLTSEGAPDAIVIHRAPTQEEVTMLANLRGTHGSPVIDLTGKLKDRADLYSDTGTPSESALREVINAFDERRRFFHSDLDVAESDEEALILRLYAKDSELKPSYDSSERSAFRYNMILPTETIFRSAAKLESQGLLESSFFDRVNTCPSCSSARILAREECPKCRSANMREEFYLHHYRCAWQGPESDFKFGDDLICPKCRYELVHFGKDYDKPGSMLICDDCGHVTTEPEVGFTCTDCLEHFEGERANIVDIKKYKITDRANEFIEAGRVALGETRRSFRFSDLPIELVVELNAMARDYMETGREFSLASIGYKNLRSLERERGIRACDQARELLLNLIKENIEYYSKSGSGQAYDYIVVRDVTAQKLEAELNSEIAKQSDALVIPLEPVATVFGAKDLGS